MAQSHRHVLTGVAATIDSARVGYTKDSTTLWVKPGDIHEALTRTRQQTKGYVKMPVIPSSTGRVGIKLKP